MSDQRNNITKEGFLESYLLKIIETGDLELISRLFKDVKDPRIIEKALLISDSKALNNVKQFLIKKAEKIINDPETLKNASQKEDLQKSLDSLCQTLEVIKIRDSKSPQNPNKDSSSKSTNEKRANNQTRSDNVDLDKLLVDAVSKGNSNDVSSLINKGANVNAKNENGIPILAMAINNRNGEIASILLQKNAKLSVFAIQKDAFDAIKDQINPKNKSDELSDQIKNIGFLEDNLKSDSLKSQDNGRIFKSDKIDDKKSDSAINSAINKIQNNIDKESERLSKELEAIKARQEVMEMLESEYLAACKMMLHFGEVKDKENQGYTVFGGKNPSASGEEIKPEIIEEKRDISIEESPKNKDLNVIYDVAEILNNVKDQALLEKYLIQAVNQGNSFMVVALINRGLDLTKMTGSDSPLKLALEKGDALMSQILILSGATLNFDLSKTTQNNAEKIPESASQSSEVTLEKSSQMRFEPKIVEFELNKSRAIHDKPSASFEPILAESIASQKESSLSK